MADEHPSTNEVHLLVENIRAEVRSGFIDLRKDIQNLENKVAIANGRTSKLELSQAIQRGWLQAISFIIGLPAVVLTAVTLIKVLDS